MTDTRTPALFFDEQMAPTKLPDLTPTDATTLRCVYWGDDARVCLVRCDHGERNVKTVRKVATLWGRVARRWRAPAPFRRPSSRTARPAWRTRGAGAAVRVLVTGGRDYPLRDHVFRVLDEIHKKTPIEMISHGACGWNGDDLDDYDEAKLRGADRWAHQWASERRVACLALAAKWTTNGKAAGPIRNAALIAYGADSRSRFRAAPERTVV